MYKNNLLKLLNANIELQQSNQSFEPLNQVWATLTSLLIIQWEGAPEYTIS